jgi:hypothetical protein
MYTYSPIMTSLGRRAGTLAVYVLVALAALALPLEASEPIHVHHGDAPAFYNGECLLAALAAFHGLAPLPSRPATLSTGLAAGGALLLAAPGVVAPLARHADPRAPPLPLI